MGGGKPKGGNDGGNVDHSTEINDKVLFGGSRGLPSSTSRFTGSRQSSSGGITPQNSRLSANSGGATKQNSKTDATAKPIKNYFGTQSSEKLKDVAPRLVESWKKALPNSLATRDETGKTMARIFGAKGDSWVPGQKVRDIQNAVKEGRWNHPSLSGLKDEEIKTLRNDPSRRREFVSGIKSLNPKKFY